MSRQIDPGWTSPVARQAHNRREARASDSERKAERRPRACGGPDAGIDAGWSSPVARQAHNLKVVGSNPTPATNAPFDSGYAASSGRWRRAAILPSRSQQIDMARLDE